MGSIKSTRISGVSFPFIVCVYVVLLLCGSCAVVFSQSCRDKQSREMKMEELPEASKCEDVHDSKGLNSADEDFKDENDHVETGLDFIPPDYDLELDREFFFGPASQERLKKVDTLELVRMFIRNVKGFPVERQPQIYGSPIGSGTDARKKPAWCFYPYLLKDLVKVELSIYDLLQQYYAENIKERTFYALESYLRDIEESSLRALRNVEASNVGSKSPEDPYLYIATHPLLVYGLIRRFAEDLQPILAELEPESDELLASLDDANPNMLVFPTLEDLYDALQGISRTQHGHDLKTYDFGRGILAGVDTGIHLNALHSLEVGAYYLTEGDYDYSIEWFHFALETSRKSVLAKNHPDIKAFLSTMLDRAIIEHNAKFNMKFSNFWYPDVFNTTVTVPFEPTSYIRRWYQLKPSASKARNDTAWNWALKTNFYRLCSGEILQTDEEISMLKCWYESSSNNYWLIHPLKTELLNMDPPVFQIYDFIGDKLIERIKNEAVSKLQRSEVIVINDHTKSTVDSTRTSSQTGMYENQPDNTFLAPLSRKMELMSGLVILKPLASDAFQVAAYGSSHHYEAHIDSFDDPRRCVEKGNRITTIMGYMSDVKVGGRTAFPVTGTFAEPIKGSIVMWDNLLRNGEKRDERTWHGGCPVVLGVKWITNKWVHYKENMFSFQCSLNPDE